MNAYLHGAVIGADAVRGTGLSNQYIVLRIDHVDGPTLQKKLASMNESTIASLAPAMVSVVDTIPKAVVDIALPFAKKELKNFGVTASIVAANVPPVQGGRDKSELFPGIAIGATAASVVALVWKFVF